MVQASCNLSGLRASESELLLLMNGGLERFTCSLQKYSVSQALSQVLWYLFRSKMVQRPMSGWWILKSE